MDTEKKEGHEQAEDVAMKSGMEFFGNEILPKLGEKEEIDHIAPTEKVRVEAKKMYEDFTYVMKSGKWNHYEFESDRITKDDLRRFREYEAFTSLMNRVDVVTHVICTAGADEDMLELNTGISTYRVKVSYTQNEKAEEVFARLREKRAELLSKEELVEVVFSPILGGMMPKVERVLEAITLLRMAGPHIRKEELSKMEAMLYVLAVKFLNKTDLEKVKERFNMTILGQMIFDDGRAEGRAEEREHLRISYIRKLIKKGMDVCAISDMLEEEESFVAKVVRLIGENLTSSDLEIAKLMKDVG